MGSRRSANRRRQGRNSKNPGWYAKKQLAKRPPVVVDTLELVSVQTEVDLFESLEGETLDLVFEWFELADDLDQGWVTATGSKKQYTNKPYYNRNKISEKDYTELSEKLAAVSHRMNYICWKVQVAISGKNVSEVSNVSAGLDHRYGDVRRMLNEWHATPLTRMILESRQG